MKSAIVAYFDIGVSFGITDHVFQSTSLTPLPDMRNVGFIGPFGSGVTVDLNASDSVGEVWREEALTQLTRTHFDVGWRPNYTESVESFGSRVRQAVATHRIETIDVTVYALGTAYIRLEFSDGVDPILAYGVMQAFEFAAYTPSVSSLIIQSTRSLTLARLSSGIRSLDYVSRPAPTIQRDQNGNEELRTFTGFTALLICANDEDDRMVRSIRVDWGYEDDDLVEFEDAQLFFHWSGCLIVAPRSENMPTRSLRIERPLALIRAAHVAQGSCELVEQVLNYQVTLNVEANSASGHVQASPEQLNRLRALSLAVVQLSSYGRLSQNIWDVQYLEKYEAYAQLREQRQRITATCDVLYNVQIAEQQRKDGLRERRINLAIFTLAVLTVVSVNVDAYGFIRDEDPLIVSRTIRLLILASLGIVITAAAALLWRQGPLFRRRS